MKLGKRVEEIAGIAALVALLIGAFLVVRPFLSAILLGLILTVSAWPLYRRVLARVGDNKTLAALSMTLLFALALIVPVLAVMPTLGEQAARISKVMSLVYREGMPPAPEWITGLPVVGERFKSLWEQLSPEGERFLGFLEPYLGMLAKGAVRIGVTFGGAALELVIALALSFLFFRDGVELAIRLRSVVEKLAGTRAASLVATAESTLKGVVYGILGTALLQAILLWLGLAISGVPSAGLLGAASFFFALLPIGPAAVWIPATIWLFVTSQIWSGVFLVIWGGLIVSGSDNLIRPLLISQRSNLPIVLILMGILGGAMQFGFLGIFLGPTLLALVYSLLMEWVRYTKQTPHHDETPA